MLMPPTEAASIHRSLDGGSQGFRAEPNVLLRFSWNDLPTPALAFPIEVIGGRSGAPTTVGGTDGKEFRSFRSPAQTGPGAT